MQCIDPRDPYLTLGLQQIQVAILYGAVLAPRLGQDYVRDGMSRDTAYRDNVFLYVS